MVVLRTRPNDLAVTRFGFAIGKRLGGAVVRNSIRRRIREVLRRLDVVPGYDVVVIGRQPILEASYGDLQAGLTQALHRARLLAAPSAG